MTKPPISKAYDEEGQRIATELQIAHPGTKWYAYDSFALWQRGQSDLLDRDVYLIRAERNSRYVEAPIAGQAFRHGTDLAKHFGQMILYQLSETRHNL